MANWLQRARREIAGTADQGTANSAEGILSAVTAVPEPSESAVSAPSIGGNGSAPQCVLSKIEETAIRGWLAHIGEDDEEVTAEILGRCRGDDTARAYFLHRAEEVPQPIRFDDDRRHCSYCTHVTPSGLCLAAARGEIAASRTYRPDDGLPRRCEGYAPGPNDPDRRTGRERWPEETSCARC